MITNWSENAAFSNMEWRWRVAWGMTHTVQYVCIHPFSGKSSLHVSSDRRTGGWCVQTSGPAQRLDNSIYSFQPTPLWHGKSPRLVRQKEGMLRKPRQVTVVVVGADGTVLHSEWPREQCVSAWARGLNERSLGEEGMAGMWTDSPSRDSWAVAVRVPIDKWEDRRCFHDDSTCCLKMTRSSGINFLTANTQTDVPTEQRMLNGNFNICGCEHFHLNGRLIVWPIYVYQKFICVFLVAGRLHIQQQNSVTSVATAVMWFMIGCGHMAAKKKKSWIFRSNMKVKWKT